MLGRNWRSPRVTGVENEPFGMALNDASKSQRATTSSPRALNAMSCGLFRPPPVMTPFGTAFPRASKTYRLISLIPQHSVTNSSPVAGCAMTPRGAVLPRPAVMAPFDTGKPVLSNVNRSTLLPNLCATNISPALNVAKCGALKAPEPIVALNVGNPPGSEKREIDPKLPGEGVPWFTTNISPVSRNARQHGLSKLG